MINIDYHLHTYYSDDSNYPMEDLVLDAINIGLNEICITDHYDFDTKQDWKKDLNSYNYLEKVGLPPMNVKCPAYFIELNKLKEKYKDRITILRGMEFGMQTHTIKKFEELYKKYPMDFIILSCHEIDNKEIWLQQYQDGKTQLGYNRGYYNEILNIIRQYKNYSVLGHLDMIVRYDLNGECRFELVEDIVREILKKVINDGKGIEINTSCYRYKLHDLTPNKNILLAYKELGGKILTIGSDSHKKDSLCNSKIKETLSIIKDLGFDYICTYRNMKPTFNKI